MPVDDVAFQSSRKAWWGGPGPKPVVKAVSICSKPCSMNNLDAQTATLDHTFEYAAMGCRMRRPTRWPRCRRPFIAPRESFLLPPPVETTSESDDTIGEKYWLPFKQTSSMAGPLGWSQWAFVLYSQERPRSPWRARVESLRVHEPVLSVDACPSQGMFHADAE
ncbi:hypothetical protein AZE42_11774 [Rhizopogon vesiculosus]|uniref:Uncharacterized protein n=1 Tax=Rhizopogon vesiculosus TaxID=180088 RepID=A0A1J8PIB5_9AGAM|nr:hypothetical protein AZE42_11774 [Rhizopogon vesiculosus]